MSTRSDRIRLGIFLIASVTVLVALVLTLAGIKLSRTEVAYQVKFEESVSGLDVGAQVKYKGVRVGKVADVRIDPKDMKHVVVELKLRKGTPVKADTQAVLVAMGITGLKFVELTGGTPGQPDLPPGGTIFAGHSFIGTLEGKAENIAIKSELALSKLNAVLSEDNIARVSDTILRLRSLVANLEAIAVNNRERADQLMTDLSEPARELKPATVAVARSAQSLDALLRSSRPKVVGILDNAKKGTQVLSEAAKDVAEATKDLKNVKRVLEEMVVTLNTFNKHLEAADVARIAEGLRRTIEEADAAMRSVRRIAESSRQDFHRSSRSLRVMLRNLEELSSELRDRPSLLLSSDPPDKRTPSED